MNRIINGDFSSGFDNWTNGVGGGLPFTLDAEQAKAGSAENSTTEQYYAMLQQFSINDEVLTGEISIWCKWLSTAPPGGTDGYTRFRIILQKPDTVQVVLLDTTKTGESGNSYLLNSADIKANLNLYGNYILWMSIRVASSSVYIPPAPPVPGFYVYAPSYGWYDNISLDVTVKKYKTVHEAMGGSEDTSFQAPHREATASDIVGLAESYSKKISKLTAEVVGLHEAYSTETFSPVHNEKASSDVAGLVESYSILRGHIASEIVGLNEGLEARRTQGNVITIYTIADLTSWDVIPGVDTPWIKVRVEILPR